VKVTELPTYSVASFVFAILHEKLSLSVTGDVGPQDPLAMPVLTAAAVSKA